MFDWAIGGLGNLFGFVGGAVGELTGWAWEKVVQGIYGWLANGLALLIEWVWSILDSGTTPRLTADWFRNDVAARVGLLALAVTVAMMLASATQAALAGRPEQIGDAIKHGIRAVVASALTLTILDVLIGVVDEASALVWQVGRADMVAMIERMVVVATTTGALGATFVGPLCLLFGFLGLLGLVVALLMRSALIYVVAALAPIVWSSDVLPLFRGSGRRLVHLGVALVVSKLAIVITLVVAVKLIANPSGDPTSGALVNDGAAAVGTLMSGFVCFLIAAVTPLTLYKVMPTVEGAVVASGVAGGWGRSAASAASTTMLVKNLSASAGARAATRPVGGQGGVAGAPSAAPGPAGRPPVVSMQRPNGGVAGRPVPGAAPSMPGAGLSRPDTAPQGGASRDRGSAAPGTGARRGGEGPEEGGSRGRPDRPRR